MFPYQVVLIFLPPSSGLMMKTKQDPDEDRNVNAASLVQLRYHTRIYEMVHVTPPQTQTLLHAERKTEKS